MPQARAEATREAVLAAAARLFERRGYAGSTIAEILEEGQVTKGALYFHFPSKEALARAIVQEQFSWRHDQVGADVPPLQQMLELSHAFVEALQHDPLMRASIRLTLERNTFASPDDSPYQGWLQISEELLRQAQTRHELLDDVDTRSAAYTITAAVTGVQLVSEATTSRVDLHERVGDMWRILLRALARPHALQGLPRYEDLPAHPARERVTGH